MSKHFARHLQRNHAKAREVRDLQKYKPQSTERKRLLALLRNDGNLNEAAHGVVIPKRQQDRCKPSISDYSICVHCKAYFKRKTLCRHVKRCFAIQEPTKKGRALTESAIYASTQKALYKTLNKLAVKEHILNKMHADSFFSVVIEDPLIVNYGDDLLKKTKRKRSLYHISNKLRECARFLVEMRKIGSYPDMFSALKPECFDNVILATQKMASFDIQKRTFGAPSLALHFRTTLTALSDLAEKLIVRKKIELPEETIEKRLVELERFCKMVDKQWAIEIGSIALKDLSEKKSIKPKLLPVTEDIMLLKRSVEEKAGKAYESLEKSKTKDAYKILAECTLLLTIIHNRKRVGDIQYLDIDACEHQIDNHSQSEQPELFKSLTKNELLLTQNYQRITSIGKGSTSVPVLVPKKMQKYYSMLINIRRNFAWFPLENTYLFTYPTSVRWIDGTYLMQKYAKTCGAKFPHLLTSCRLRKHIATVTQVLSLRPNEIDQLAKFMGHTVKTHENFYK